MRGALDYLATHSRYYQRVFKDNGIDVSDINTIEDLQKIPFTEKKDLQLFNEDFLCCPKADIVDYVTTSGTLGDPVTFGCTEKDLQRLAYNEKKSFACAGVKHGDIVQLMTTMDKRFMAGLAYFLGIRELGASIIRVGNGIPELQWDTIRRLKPDTIMCVPSFILKLVQYAEEHGIDYRNSSIKRIIGIGEGLREQDFSLNLLGRRIKEKWDVDLFATYSSTEMGATFSECEYGCGGHVHPELIIVEIIGEDGMPVADGQPGEVVVTTLGVEGMPLLRFRTGDIGRIDTTKCSCGRTHGRIHILGRKDDMFIVSAVNVFPSDIEAVVREHKGITGEYLIRIFEKDFTNKYAVEIEKSADNTKTDDEVAAEVSAALKARIGVKPARVVVHPDGGLNTRSEHKSKRVIDERNLEYNI